MARREFLISKAWIQAVVLVVLCGFFVLGFTDPDVSRGQPAFLNHGLME